MYAKLFFLLFFSITLFSQNHSTETLDIEDKELAPYDLGLIISLIKEQKHPLDTAKYEEKINVQMAKIIKNINQEIVYDFDSVAYDKMIRFLDSKISINSKYENHLAVLRDELKIMILKNKKSFAFVINSIIEGKNSFKDKKYFMLLFENAIEDLNLIDLSKYQKMGLEIARQQDSLSTEFKDSLETLHQQIKVDLFVFNYLKTHMNEYRPSNFILDEMSLKYIIHQIDSHSYIKNLSSIFTYYFDLPLGKIIVLIGIFILFFIVNRKILPFFGRILANKLSTRLRTTQGSILDILPTSFGFTVMLILDIFALQVSLFLLIENVARLNQLTPWFNTLYLALFSYLIYKILDNYINFSSDTIFTNYPNMRKEMVDFLLRILKVVISIFLVFFLLIQLGFDIKAIIASLGIGGIAIALAAKDTLSNFFGSLNIITDNSFSQGDWIEAGNVEGTVVDIRMRTTRIRTFANGMITVPNAQLANTSILNWSKRVIGRRIKMSIGITYSSKMSDIEQLVEDIREMLQNHSMIATSKLNIDKKPYLLKKEDLIGIKNTILVFIDEYAQSSINIFLYCFSRSPVWEDWLETKQDVIVKIAQLVEKNNCSFAFPTQTLYIEKNEESQEKARE